MALHRYASKTDEYLADEDIRARHQDDPKAQERAASAMKDIAEGKTGTGIAGEELRNFIRERI